jgi:hypothetical protein
VPLPNLIVIGAAKCGTTSLHAYLDDHPEIAMSRTKELNFFMGEDLGRDLAWYASHFLDAPVRGETSPGYALWPVVPGVPERMSAAVPDARLVYVVRDPIARLVAHWVHSSRWGHDPSFAEAVRDRDSRYVAGSRYATQLERYLAHFSADRILVVDSHELRRERTAALHRIFRFVGVRETATALAAPELNVGAGSIRRNRAGKLVAAGLARTLGRERAGRLRAHVPEPLTRPLTHRLVLPRVEGDLRRRLEEILRPEVDRLRELTGLPFETWSL